MDHLYNRGIGGTTLTTPRQGVGTPEYLWTVEGDSGQSVTPVGSPTAANFGFIPEDNGLFTVTLRVTDPATGVEGTEVPADSDVVLTVSDGPEPVEIPDEAFATV